MKIKKIVVPVGLILSSLVVSMVLKNTKSEPLKNTPVSKAVVVQASTFEQQDVQFVVASQGSVTAKTQTSILSQVNGLILQVSPKFVVGGFFLKDEVLLKIDSTDYKVAIQQAEANLASAEAKLTQEQAKTAQAKFEWDLTGKSRDTAPVLALREPFVKEAEAAVDSAKADVAQAYNNFAKTTVRAPYNGVVKKKNVDIGQYVARGNVLGLVFDTQSAEVRLPVTEHDLSFLKLPQAGQSKAQVLTRDVVFSSRYGEKNVQWQGKIVRTEAELDPQSRVHFAVAEIQDPYRLKPGAVGPPLKVGSFIKAEIGGIRVENIHVIPRQLIKGKSSLIVVDSKSRLRIRKVDVLRVEGLFAYVGSGLMPQDKVSTTTIASAVDGAKVQLVSQPIVR